MTETRGRPTGETAEAALAHWVQEAARLAAPSATRAATARPVAARSGSRVWAVGDVVVKVHHPRTSRPDLAARLALAVDPALARWLLPPLSTEIRIVPDRVRGPDVGRLATAWPLVDVLDLEAPRVPWGQAGALLAGLHRAAVPALEAGQVPVHRPVDRVVRALEGVTGAAEELLLRRAGRQLLAELHERVVENPVLVHGDWHLGQLGRTRDGWRLLDLDDLGLGDPAWDLSRPAGFWAAGLLDDDAWEELLAGYLQACGPAVPTSGDPWARLELPARAAVVVAACREVSRELVPLRHGVAAVPRSVRTALLEACARM